jgi:predicted sulfurtransferase
MRYYISLIAIVVISISIFTACQTAAPTMETAKTNSAAVTAQPNPTETNKTNSAPKAEDPLANVPRISLADAKKAFDEEQVVFVDTRSEVTYKAEHVKGALNIPAEAFQTRYAEVPKDKKIITYCS